MSELVTQLKSTAFGELLTATEAKEMVESAESRTLQTGACLFRSGDPGGALFVILSGSLDVVLGPPGVGATKVATLGAGQVVGETVIEQMRVAFANLRRAIDAAGAKPEHVTHIRVLIVDHREDYLEPLATEVRALFGQSLPASTLIPVPRLALDTMLFEIEATLFVPMSTV